MPEMGAEFSVSCQHLILEMVIDSLRDLHCLVCSRDIGRKENIHLEPGLLGKILEGVNNVLFSGTIEFLFMEGCGIKRIEELDNGR